MNTKGKSYGLTLIELLLTVAVLAILSTLAYPSLRSYILESRRVDGMDALQDMAMRLERYYAQNAAYTDDESLIGYGSDGVQRSTERYYNFSITAADATTYTITATARADQNDDSIQAFILNSDGSKQYQDSDGNTLEGWED